MKLLIVNGPNMNMLHLRGSVYGGVELEAVNARIYGYVSEKGADADFYQSNHEGDIIDRLQRFDYDALIINAAAYSHYSYAIRDCLEMITVPKAEVHLSDIYKREAFRRNRVFDGVVDAVFYGNGIESYIEAADYLLACGA